MQWCFKVSRVKSTKSFKFNNSQMYLGLTVVDFLTSLTVLRVPPQNLCLKMTNKADQTLGLDFIVLISVKEF